jgi:hypothetical protein
VGLNNYPVLERSISSSSAGDNVIVPGVAGQVIEVYRIFFVVGADTNVTFEDGDTADFTGPIPMLANGSFVLDFTELPWFTTSLGNDFVVSLSVGTIIAGRVYYTQITPP